MNAHPLAGLFPPMAEDEFERLADSIEHDGLLEPITLYEGLILDGRHRQRACEERGVEPEYAEWDSACGITPLEWVIARNVHRRQLTTSQKAALAVEVKDQLAEAGRERKRTGGREGGLAAGRGRPKGSDQKITSLSRSIRSREVAAEQFGISEGSVQRAQEIRQRDPHVFERVKRGELRIHAAQKLVGGGSGRYTQARRGSQSLRDALAPLRGYTRNWTEERLYGVTPREARVLLGQVQQVSSVLFEIERALDARTVTSRALR